jgi:2-succinyl-5-enolpyruvyl-6-hydroxy-3-cyclohexene-1-carboxylate synthase
VTNLNLAKKILNSCSEYGVREVVICAGARNAPFVKLLSESSGLKLKVYSFFEERSAAFFALGRMQSQNLPVAIITTSGTAAAELLPACIEADYQRLPLVMITADRPKRYRGSGAPQAIVQPGLYSHYIGWSADVEGEWSGGIEGPRNRPVHLNVCFDEPLLGGVE